MRRTLTAVALLFAMAACAENTKDPTQEMPPLDVAQVLANTSEFQRDLLADKVITFAEYEKATLATIQCLREAGLTVQGPYPRSETDDRYLEYSFGFQGVASADVDENNKKMFATGDRCESAYRTDVARVWQFQHLLTPQARQEQKLLIIECLRQAGMSIAPEASHQDVLRAASDPKSDAAVKCRAKYPDYFVVGVH